MAEIYFDLERFLSETEGRTIRVAREIYTDNPELAERLANLVKELRQAKAAVVQSVRQATAA